MNNWLAAETYAYTGTLSASQWAWEFLRRNPEYGDDYAWFIRNWNILEQAYGKPPHRDFPAWKADPRASRINALGESLLIECWMGEKWGFYKFPLDPARPAPIPATELLWREPSQEAVLLSDDNIGTYLDSEPRVAFGFDLSLPMKAQVETTQRMLLVLQRQRAKSNPAFLRTVRTLHPHWTLCLRALDAASQDASCEEVGRVLTAEGNDVSPDSLLAEARSLMESGYRSILRIPDK